MEGARRRSSCHTCHERIRTLLVMSMRPEYASERPITTPPGVRDPPILLETEKKDMLRKHPDSPAKPFFGAGGSMLKQFDEHHASLTRRSSMESARASTPRSVVGIGGKGALCLAGVSSQGLRYVSQSRNQTIQRRRLYSPWSVISYFDVHELTVAQVGLPARGKSFLSNKLMRYLKVCHRPHDRRPVAHGPV